MEKFLRLIRVKHYIKNILVFVPLIFHGSLLCLEELFITFCGFVMFSFSSSIVYIINDIRDIEKDRLHPVKKHRPLASGEISLESAFGVLVILCVCVFGIHMFCEKLREGFSWVYLCLYILLNIFYSMKLKNIPIIDLAILASGFLLRILYGGAINRIVVSDWLYLTVTMVAFYMVLGKRRNELMQQPNNSTRTVLKYYNLTFLDKHMYLCLAISIVFYALWTMESKTKLLVFTVPLVLLICMKYNLNVEGNSDGDPVEVLMGDKGLFLMCLFYGIMVLISLYLV